MRRLAFIVVSVVVCTGCKERNPTYCALPENAGQGGCPADAPPSGCLGPADCMSTPSTPVCATMSSPPVCVQCTDQDKGVCAGTTPLCKNNSCAACALDSECGTGGLCLPDGACAAANNIIHATSMLGKNVAGCGVPGGPGACTLERALTEVTATKNVIKLDDKGPYTPAANNFVVNANVTIDARVSAPGGAVLHQAMSGIPILTINNNRAATIFGGTIEGASSSDGISCSPNATLTVDGTTIDTIDKSAINASSGCNLTVTHANINNTSIKGGPFVPTIVAAGASVTLSRSTLFANRGGGISITSGTFVIVGNTFLANGDPVSPLGGVSINTTTSDPMNRIEFNTISSNASISSKIPGVDCTVGTGTPTVAIARNNIIWANDNTNATSPSTVPQVGGTCKHAYSDIGMLTIGAANDGGNNLNMDPMFITPIYDVHLLSTSPMIMRADPNAKLDGVAAKDIDGDPRIAPADIGMDQRPR